MTIKKRNSKVQRSLSGGILTTPPIIDISSDYGVTKDGSNLVSVVKNRYAPNVFRAPAGSEPIENDDGIEFSTDGTILTSNKAIRFDVPFTLELWVSYTTVQNYSITFSARNFGDNSNMLDFYISSLNFGVAYYLNGVQSAGSGSGAFAPLAGTKYHVLLQYAKTQMSVIIDGVLRTRKYNVNVAQNIQTTSPKVSLGNTSGRSAPNGLNGKIYTAKFAHVYNPSWFHWEEDTFNSYGDIINDLGDQVFPPPTYPNTLL